jgi:diguanylate cyclase (GGDEF)-like protein
MLVMIDVDHFKAFNDAYGHPVGDLVLRAVADALARAFPRRSDVVARYGGEEFAVILSDAGLEDVPVLERRLLSAIRHLAVDADGRRFGVTASAGIAVAAPSETPSELLARADRALYAAKHGGRDRVVVCGLTRPGPTLDHKSDPQMQPG